MLLFLVYYVNFGLNQFTYKKVIDLSRLSFGTAPLLFFFIFNYDFRAGLESLSISA